MKNLKWILGLAVVLIAVITLTGCVSQRDFYKEIKRVDDNTVTIANQQNNTFANMNLRLRYLEAVEKKRSEAPVRDEKGQFTPAATNVPKTVEKETTAEAKEVKND
jgi:hypothetical protein